jgi:hypothetical protein
VPSYSSYQEWFNKVWILADLPYRFKPFDIFTPEQLVNMYSNGESPKSVAKKMTKGLHRVEKEGSEKKASLGENFNSDIVRKKFKSELVRTLYYLADPSGPHPWGMQNKVNPPFSLPLPINDKNAGKKNREAVEKVVNDSKFDSTIRQLLKLVRDELNKNTKSRSFS